MRTPVILVAGQKDTDPVVGALLRTPGTLVVEHRFDGHVVRRTTATLQHGVLTTAEAGLELAHGCVSCTIRNDLLVLLRQLHRRDDIDRVVVHLAPWLEPEPICLAIENVRVRVAPGYVDGPAALDVSIAAVVTCVDASVWLSEALGDAGLDDGRTLAQVVVGQAEFADVVVLNRADPFVAGVLRRLSPRARIHVGADGIEHALDNLFRDARRGRSDDPHGPLLAGQPPLDSRGPINLFDFNARRPFHPQRLHACLDLLLEGVIRTRGRLWLASQPEQAMWLESAGGWIAGQFSWQMASRHDSSPTGRHRCRTTRICRAVLGCPARRSAHSDDRTGVRRARGRNPRRPQRRAAHRRRASLPPGLGLLRRSVRRLARRPLRSPVRGH